MKIDSSGGAHTSTTEREAVEKAEDVGDTATGRDEGRRTSRRRRSGNPSRFRNRRANLGTGSAASVSDGDKPAAGQYRSVPSPRCPRPTRRRRRTGGGGPGGGPHGGPAAGVAVVDVSAAAAVSMPTVKGLSPNRCGGPNLGAGATGDRVLAGLGGSATGGDVPDGAGFARGLGDVGVDPFADREEQAGRLCGPAAQVLSAVDGADVGAARGRRSGMVWCRWCCRRCRWVGTRRGWRCSGRGRMWPISSTRRCR